MKEEYKSLFNLPESLADKIADQITSKIDQVLIEKIKEIDPNFNFELEPKRRFKRLCQEVREGVHSFYFNDGSENGIHLFSYKIDCNGCFIEAKEVKQI